MSVEVEGKFIIPGLHKSGPKRSRTGVIYIPSSLVKDPKFPLKDGDRVKIALEGDRLVVRKVE